MSFSGSPTAAASPGMKLTALAAFRCGTDSPAPIQPKPFPRDADYAVKWMVSEWPSGGHDLHHQLTGLGLRNRGLSCDNSEVPSKRCLSGQCTTMRGLC